MLLVQIACWLSIAAVGYAYVGYPMVVWLASRGRRDAWVQTDLLADRDPLPFVSLVIAAYKEERYILSRLNNAIALDYPGDKLEILVGCDGNEDGTGDLTRTFRDHRVRLIQFPQRRGKASVLNDVIPQAQGEIVVFSDANTMMHPQALRRLVRHFRNDNVGGVCGKLELTDPLTGQNVDGAYWKYENFLKGCEARLGALLGVNGGIYALRKPLYQPLAANTIIDDFVIGMRVHQQGRGLLYDATAVAYEETPETVGAEFHRRARIGAGGFQSLMWLASLLSPRHGWLAFCFLSHKVVRWCCPAFLLTALVTNACLLRQPAYVALMAAQIGFYIAAFVGLRLPHGQGWQRPFRLPAMFVSMNLALAVGFWRWIKGIRSGTWKRTERAAREATANQLQSPTL